VVVEFFDERAKAETFSAEVCGDEPYLADLLRIEPVAFEVAPN
jgi:hypothetical protein